ncbi:hypothetical protein SAMD00019534_005220 [Acytostelium subglobosum LB1]|uniref:hypothetical protein n=1 Tax=Acytostelium subglobosum LB1 TaxID=1410327 RepID=UPI0006449CD3|nr:hypothetical protein SAMD00019534_005220 [Acytostelium subglobosum LB1]GAM17347.1 hypothetical protein SAMD00019534_005220 [Acytostelium subglobosum LB1]|eukprot:XP_012759409.1 hypothetical protein SAMD00019534_005220 [Acytostelium subglobosum LB1]
MSYMLDHFNPLTLLKAPDELLTVYIRCCKLLDDIGLQRYSMLIYLLMRAKSIPMNTNLWINGIRSIVSFKQNHVGKSDTIMYRDVLLKIINWYCLPEIFSVDRQLFEESNCGIKRIELIELCWRYTVTRPMITMESVLDIQRFLQQLADSDTSSKPRLVIDLVHNVDNVRNDYFERLNKDDDADHDYDYEIELGIYCLTTTFYLSAYRYFKFLITGTTVITQKHTGESVGNSGNSGNVGNTDNTLIFDINSVPLYMLTHQVLYYSNANELFVDKYNSISYNKQMNEAIRYLTLCMDSYSDLNQDPWKDRYKELSETWSDPEFYWMSTSLADCHYYYESYSTSLSFYKKIKQQLSGFSTRTLLPLPGNRMVSFDPTDDLWVNRLFLHIAMTNHSEIESSIRYLLEVLISIPLADFLPPTSQSLHTIKPYFAPFTQQEITFWCIDSLAACYERLGMVGEMTVLYQCYWQYYRPRFQMIVYEIQKSGSTSIGRPLTISPPLVDLDKDGLPLSNISKKDLQKGFFFPRFFEYIINIDMLEEFSLLLNQGYRLDILQGAKANVPNKELLMIIEQHITSSTKRSDISLSQLLNKFFVEELEHFTAKQQNKMTDD